MYGITRVTRAPTPEFAALVPYDIVLVTMDEGFRIMAHGRGPLACDDRVRIEFTDVGGRALPLAPGERTVARTTAARPQRSSEFEQAPNPESRVVLGARRDALGQRRLSLHWELSQERERSEG